MTHYQIIPFIDGLQMIRVEATCFSINFMWILRAFNDMFKELLKNALKIVLLPFTLFIFWSEKLSLINKRQEVLLEFNFIILWS